MLLKKEWRVSVERPIAEVFDSYVDRVGEVWGIGEVEFLTDGPIGAGTRFRPVGDPRWGIRDPSAVIEVDRFEPPRLLALSWVVNVPGHVETQRGFSTLFNSFVAPGWGTEGTVQVHFLEVAENRTRLVILGSNRISHWAAQVVTLVTRWFGYWWIGSRHKQFKRSVEGRKGIANLSV